ncbi:MAG: hypothetical protein QW470_00970 [Candidatus Caldarchaeum sp.]
MDNFLKSSVELVDVQRTGVSYIVGVLLVLAITMGAVVIFSSIVGFQAQTALGLHALDVRRTGESVVVFLAHRYTGDLIVYNNGIIPVCIAGMSIVELGTNVNFSPCVNVLPNDYAVIDVFATPWPAGGYTIILRTSSNKLMTFKVFVR